MHFDGWPKSTSRQPRNIVIQLLILMQHYLLINHRDNDIGSVDSEELEVSDNQALNSKRNY
jgi:hypothetical protein